jgi:hypothetical protein
LRETLPEPAAVGFFSPGQGAPTSGGKPGEFEMQETAALCKTLHNGVGHFEPERGGDC